MMDKIITSYGIGYASQFGILGLLLLRFCPDSPAARRHMVCNIPPI